MAYISLYRKYRPDTFDKVIGQDHIVRTLVNQIKNKTFSHAYLLTGTRGTGKTTVARIFARAINCKAPQNGSPCGKCECCKETLSPASLDIMEIDAASNNGVDEIRELRERVKYPPVGVPYKVYIIDEVHMLTTSAFNALLKTLEEPPEHVIFILATTEVHKLPQTILSRCQRFDFRLVSIELLTQNLKFIFNDIGRKYEEEAVRLIASAGAGSVRDTQSIADMCLSYCPDIVTYSGVLEALGASDPNVIVDLASDIISGDIGGALGILDKLFNMGKNMAVLSSDLAEDFRAILYIKNSADAQKQLSFPRSVFEKLAVLCNKISNERILLILDILNTLAGDLRYTTHPRILTEAAIVRAITEKDTSPNAAIAAVRRLEARINKIEADGIKSSSKQNVQNIPIQSSSVVALPNAKIVPQRADLSDLELYKELIKRLKQMGQISLGLALEGERAPEQSDDGVYLVAPTKKENIVIIDKRENIRVITDILFDITGKRFLVKVEPVEEKISSEGDAAALLKDIFGADRFREIK